ncbi:SDR family NAD(P)-dependent oxidoreductase [Roseococcus pinisoli]|uniref:SDR family NAD(P)-dependent oxidoreductase n=1 Tax=Roseococcus pinisoli TaxID=2835040 RepID=A0ABS5QJY7_9PROT|nr:SDR family NAD(P)-dependent oxidoreductase [Roseococcus pinisoli]MBS7813200.1 SDR family NAD(P)-dependent oxidoreductase [Roseococcus pinisoli]
MPWANVLITGASSGIGSALAEACAGPGVTLHLSARTPARLEGIIAACEARGATVRPVAMDVRNAEGMAAWIGAAGRLDLVIANAGVGAGTGDSWESARDCRAVFETNLMGVLNTALPAIDAMAAQAPGPGGLRGRIAVVASIAAFVASPSAPAYGASKSAAQRWAEARDATERKRGIRMHSVNPGFVRTPMTAVNEFPMPFLMEPARAAQRALDGIAAGRTRIVFPRRLYAMARIVDALPLSWRTRLLMAAPPKPHAEPG